MMTISLTKMDTLEAKTIKALLDSGATDCFLDWNYVKQNHFRTRRLDRAIPVYNVDGTLNSNGSITHTCELMMCHEDHTEQIRFYITDLRKKEIIIGHSWLSKHNPTIDWRTGHIKYNRCPAMCGKWTKEKADLPEEEKFLYHTFFSKLPKFKNPELGI